MKKNLSYVLIDNNKYDGSDPVDYNNLLKKVMDIETNDMENLDDPDMQPPKGVTEKLMRFISGLEQDEDEGFGDGDDDCDEWGNEED